MLVLVSFAAVSASLNEFFKLAPSFFANFPASSARALTSPLSWDTIRAASSAAMRICNSRVLSFDILSAILFLLPFYFALFLVYFPPLNFQY
jgi:hypothetical protein